MRWITSDIYDNKLKEYKEIQQGLLEEMQRHSIADESYYLAVNQVLSLSQRASEIFESSEPNEKRQLLNYLLQNCRLNERSLLFELKKPFDALVKYNKCPEMLPLLDAFRTFDWKELKQNFALLQNSGVMFQF